MLSITCTQPSYLPNYFLLQGFLPLLLPAVQVLHAGEVFWLDGNAAKLFLELKMTSRERGRMPGSVEVPVTVYVLPSVGNGSVQQLKW